MHLYFMKRIQSLFILIIVLFSLSCGDNGSSEPEIPIDNFDRKELLIDAADGIIIPAFEDYVSRIQILNSAAQSFVVEPSISNLDLLRGYWLQAYKSWQYISMFNLGKAEEIGLRNFTNIYPSNTLEIDENISSGDYNLDLPSKNDEQGFPALDYLLYGIGNNDEEILIKYEQESYSIYLTDLTQKIEYMGTDVLNDWNTGYREIFVNNDGTSATSSLNKLVNDYLFYYERFLRAGKIGIPAGVFSGDPLKDKVEGFYAKEVSKELFLTGLQASKRFFNGTNYNTVVVGTGLKAYLDYLNTIKGGDDLSLMINAQFDATQEKAEDLDENFAAQIESDNLKMLATYDELQKNVILLKVDMLQALNIKIDFVDADGD
jgi:predicted lipoprotein